MQRLVDVVPQYRLTGWCCHPCVPTPQRRSASACASGLPQSQSGLPQSQSGLLLAVCSFETVLASLSLYSGSVLTASRQAWERLTAAGHGLRPGTQPAA
jgi:hypothetical protein